VRPPRRPRASRITVFTLLSIDTWFSPGIALGVEFRRAERLRQVSDYLGEAIEPGTVLETLQQARELVRRVKLLAADPRK